MKKSFVTWTVVLTGLVGTAFGQLVSDLDDLIYWGTGTNRAAFVVYWNDSKSPDALAWGYRWSGTQTVEDMLGFLAANDPRLFARIDSSTGFGLGVFGLGYQTGAAAFGVTGAQDPGGNAVTPAFISGIDNLNTNPSGTESPFSSLNAEPLNSADRYKEGWNDNGFWELFHSGTDNFELQASFTLPTTWTSSFVGAGVELVNESWAAFSITQADFSSNPPTATVTAAVPEPSTFLLIGLGSLVFLIRKNRS